MKELRAFEQREPVTPAALTATMQKLNPQVGEAAPHLAASLAPGQGGGDRQPPPGPPTLRRPINPPTGPLPPPLQFTSEQVVSKVRNSDCASSGGPTGHTYLHLRDWFAVDDTYSTAMTATLNLIMAGNVPESTKAILNAGRGVVIPKDDAGALRPIVVGHVILRLCGALSLKLSAGAVDRYFMGGGAKQFGVGVANGCGLMASAVEERMRQGDANTITMQIGIAQSCGTR